MIVVDTNLLVYLHVPSRLTPDAEAVFEHDPLWICPLLWRSEFRNAMIGLVRQRTLSLDLARDITRQAELWMSRREYTVATDEVLRLAADSGCTAYDCEFVAVASDLDLPLVTADRQVLRAFPLVAVHPRTFLS